MTAQTKPSSQRTFITIKESSDPPGKTSGLFNTHNNYTLLRARERVLYAHNSITKGRAATLPLLFVAF